VALPLEEIHECHPCHDTTSKSQLSVEWATMKPPPPSARLPSRESLKAISYDDTTAAKTPIPITVAKPPPTVPPKGLPGLRRPQSSNQRLSPQAARSKLHDDVRRDSGLAPSSSTARDSRTTLGTDMDSTSSIRHSPSIPSVSAYDETHFLQSSFPADGENTHSSEERNALDPSLQTPFMSILTEIPTGSFEDLTIPGQVEFSKRGSMLIGGKKANKANGEALSHGGVVGSRRQQYHGLALPPPPVVPKRILSADDEALSQKVRSLYQGVLERDSDQTVGISNVMRNGITGENLKQPSLRVPSHMHNTPEIITNGSVSDRAPSRNESARSTSDSAPLREQSELAGGIEDWEDLNGGDVDRYGFIVPRKVISQASSLNSHRPISPEIPQIQRMSTLLQLASDTPRRHRSTLKKSNKSPARSAHAPSTSRPASSVVRPLSSQSSYRTINGKESRMRSAANRLPHNKDRRCVDEAGDMLTLPPGLDDIAEDEDDNKTAENMKKREWEREEKWRKMAKVKTNRQGGGMVFEFDTNSPKVIERTWKGIPDRWRATAWHAFLTSSAKKRRGSPSDDELIAVFKSLVDEGSPDDVQIDIDVPRTINSHIMFRRRYRGGQRLLFRVLHCLSIYFPDTGYVQGMAALAATLLCYFDEEMTFVMLVRLWQLRGLERLYQSGFEGLMQALEEFEKDWLGNGEVAAKLVSLTVPYLSESRIVFANSGILQNDHGITATAYGTRWYLTLFNYSIPFPAQLRVWDVFMLLGDPDIPLPPILTPSTTTTNGRPTITTTIATNNTSFNGGLDILHAVSAALIDGTREILLDSDFENAMKVLTSWIPVKDEEMLMRVARVEWKMRKRRKAASRVA